MISEPDLISFQHTIRNNSIEAQDKSNKIRQSSSLRQMTWIQNPSQTNSVWCANENTFLTNVNSLSSLDPVVQSYVDQQIKSEFPKMNKPYIDFLNKLKEQFDNHLNDNKKSFDDIYNFLKDIQEKLLVIETKVLAFANIKEENEKTKKEIDGKSKMLDSLEEMLKSLKDKINRIESEQQKIEFKKDDMSKIKELQTQITSMNDSTVKCISYLQEKIDDCSVTVKNLETVHNSNLSKIKDEYEFKLNGFQSSIESNKLEYEKQINEINSKVDRNFQYLNNNEKLFEKYASKNDVYNIQKSLKLEFEQEINKNVSFHNQAQNDLREELSKLKEKIEQDRDLNQHPNIQDNTDYNLNKIHDLEIKVQELETKVRNLESSFQSINLLPTTVSLIQEKIININKEEVFVESQIKNIESEVNKIKVKLAKLDHMTITTFQSTVDIIGSGVDGQFELTIGEPDIGLGSNGIQLFLPKSYQDYTFHSSSCPTFDLMLKEPNEPKSGRKQKSRKFKK